MHPTSLHCCTRHTTHEIEEIESSREWDVIMLKAYYVWGGVAVVCACVCIYKGVS